MFNVRFIPGYPRDFIAMVSFVALAYMYYLSY